MTIFCWFFLVLLYSLICYISKYIDNYRDLTDLSTTQQPMWCYITIVWFMAETWYHGGGNIITNQVAPNESLLQTNMYANSCVCVTHSSLPWSHARLQWNSLLLLLRFCGSGSFLFQFLFLNGFLLQRLLTNSYVLMY